MKQGHTDRIIAFRYSPKDQSETSWHIDSVWLLSFQTWTNKNTALILVFLSCLSPNSFVGCRGWSSWNKALQNVVHYGRRGREDANVCSLHLRRQMYIPNILAFDTQTYILWMHCVTVILSFMGLQVIKNAFGLTLHLEVTTAEHEFLWPPVSKPHALANYSKL